MKAQYKDLKFKSENDLQAWLKGVAKLQLILQDHGQDIMNLWVDEKGEILNCDCSSFLYNGLFVDMDLLKEGRGLMVCLDGKDWTLMSGLILEEKNKLEDPQ